MSIMDHLGWRKPPAAVNERSIWRIVRNPMAAARKPPGPSRYLMRLRDSAIAGAEALSHCTYSVHLDAWGLLPCGLGVGLLGLLADKPHSLYWCGQLVRMWPSHDARLSFATTRAGWLFSLGDCEPETVLHEALDMGYVVPLVMRANGSLLRRDEDL